VNEEGGTAQDRPILDRPILDEDGFQRLLAAAYILQPQKQHPRAQPMAAAPKRPFAAGKIIQKRTPSLLVRNSPPPASWTPSWTMSAPIFWKASEALVIAAIFVVAAVSILSPLSARTTHSAEATEQRVAYERATAAAKVWGPARQSLVKLGSSQSSSQVSDGKNRLTAADIIAGYEKENDDTDLRSPAVEKPATDLARPLPTGSRLSQSRTFDGPPLKSGARLAFGRDADMLAAATVTRYGPDAWTYRWQDQKKAPQTSLTTNRSAN
jgi:hypothetical protein